MALLHKDGFLHRYTGGGALKWSQNICVNQNMKKNDYQGILFGLIHS